MRTKKYLSHINIIIVFIYLIKSLVSSSTENNNHIIILKSQYNYYNVIYTPYIFSDFIGPIKKLHFICFWKNNCCKMWLNKWSTVEGEFGEYLLLQVYYLSMVGMKRLQVVMLRCRSTLRISIHVVPYLSKYP